MNKVTLDDLSLRDISLDNLPRLKELRDQHFASRPEICIELPRLMTQYMKNMDDPDDSPELRAAKRLKYILENKRPGIEDNSLLAGTTTTKPVGAIMYPDFLALPIWPSSGHRIIGVLRLQRTNNRKVTPFLWLPWRAFSSEMPETRGASLLIENGDRLQVLNYEMDEVCWWHHAEEEAKFEELKQRFEIH